PKTETKDGIVTNETVSNYLNQTKPSLISDNLVIANHLSTQLQDIARQECNNDSICELNFSPNSICADGSCICFWTHVWIDDLKRCVVDLTASIAPPISSTNGTNRFLSFIQYVKTYLSPTLFYLLIFIMALALLIGCS